MVFKLVHRLRRWPNIKTTLFQRLLLAVDGVTECVQLQTGQMTSCVTGISPRLDRGHSCPLFHYLMFVVQGMAQGMSQSVEPMLI